ncbi:DUF6883 domain-containing protein [Prosthecobacter sp. SYSU 5D2]|uniref:LPD3 domain-containing protein n=1 Tax=Prosthecobacter sp. SYSU 5D2 TaxID=3134134 RepID=UPI0031FEB851
MSPDPVSHASNDVAVIEAYSALTRLWATGTRKGNAITGAVRSQEASIIRAQRNRLRKAEKDGVAPGLMKKLKETAEFFHQVLKQTARLMKAKKEGKLGDIEEFLNESVGLSQQAAHVESLEVVAAAPEETAAGAPGIDSASDFQQRTRLQEVLNGQSGGVTFSLTLKNLDEARIHLRGLSGKPMTTADGLTANISNQTAAKMVSSSAVRKSADIDTHLAAIENIEVLFQTGKITESKPDRDNDPNIKAVHRVHSQMGPYDVKFTVKELVQMEQGNRIYSIEAIETERASERKRDDADTLAGPTSSPQSEALSQDTLDMEESQTFSLTSQNALWHGITGYDKRGNPKTVVILGRQSSGAYSLSINGTLRDFDEAQTAAITGLPPGQLRTLSSGDASHEPVQMVEPPVAKQPDPTPADPPPKDGSKTQEPASDPSDKKHLTGTTEESISYKLRTYLLDPKHPEGGPKSVWFKGALGFTQSNVDDLGRQLVFDPQTAKTTKTTEFGQKFNQIISLKGANGKVISVTVCWIRNPDGVIRLVTILPEDK